ncbi:MAG: DoxX-like family protein, partial [Parvularculaceae bacterium]|nr:DoxX-like family protein [Parvularculaceae bacterium]
VLRGGVLGDPAPWRAAAGRGLRPLSDTLLALEPTAQERAFSRVAFLLPLMVLVLALFWIASGLIGAARVEAAAALIPGASPEAARALVYAGSAGDVAIGALLLVRRTARFAALASIVLAGAYLVVGTLVTPALWADPLGPFVKVVPAMALAAAVALLLEAR